MWHLGPIFRSLLKRKLNAFLLLLQVAIVSAIFANSAALVMEVHGNTKRESGISEDKMFSITLRPIEGFLDYTRVQEETADINKLDFVESVSATRWSPVSYWSEGTALRTESDPEAATTGVSKGPATHEILTTLELGIVAGRDFTLADMAITGENNSTGPNSAIVTQALAEELFESANEAVGKFVYDGDEAREIVGVSENWWGFSRPWSTPHELTVFYPTHNDQTTEYRYLIRVDSAKNRPKVVEDVTNYITNKYNYKVLLWIERIDEIRESADKPNIIYSWMFIVMMIVLGFFIAFAISAQTLFSIAQRTKQIGIRRALGASRKDIVTHLQIENMFVCISGLLLGLLLSIGINAVVQQAVGDSPMEPWLLAITSFAFILICFASAAVPAWKAANISPSIATRSV